MISSVQNTQSYANTQASQSSQNRQSSISDYQKVEIASILENYDSTSLSKEDAQAIVSSFQDLGINPSKELAETMSESGFDAFEVGSLAGVSSSQGAQQGEAMAQMGGMPPPPPPPSSSTSSTEESEDEIAALLEALLQAQEEQEEDEAKENLSKENNNSFLEELSNYSSKIMSLDEKSKSSVMELFNQYTQNSNDLSKEDVSSIVQSSLGQILSDSNNYNKNTFYA